jgi:hypothetical protein
MEEEILLDADDGNLDGADICNIDNDRDVSVSVTLNLKKQKPSTSKKVDEQPKPQEEKQHEASCNPCDEYSQEAKKGFKTKAEELAEMEQTWQSQKRRTSIIPSTDEQQKNYVSILHPEEFPSKSAIDVQHKTPHEHHQHLHNVGYSEWMKKIVDHHSSHLTLSDSDSDSDVPLDEVQMLPLYCGVASEKNKKKKRKK